MSEARDEPYRAPLSNRCNVTSPCEISGEPRPSRVGAQNGANVMWIRSTRRAALLIAALSGCSADPKVIQGANTDAQVADTQTTQQTSCALMSGTLNAPWRAAYRCTCTAGTIVTIGCSALCAIGGDCVGDPVLAVCSSTTSATTCSMSIGQSNDDCNGERCPALQGLSCPSSGVIVALTRPYEAGAAYHCIPSVAR